MTYSPASRLRVFLPRQRIGFAPKTTIRKNLWIHGSVLPAWKIHIAQDCCLVHNLLRYSILILEVRYVVKDIYVVTSSVVSADNKYFERFNQGSFSFQILDSQRLVHYMKQMMQRLWSKTNGHNFGSDSFSLFLQAVSKDGLNKTWTCEESLMLSDMLSVMIISIDENLRHNSKGVISGNGEDENRLGHYGKKQSGQSDKGVEPNSKGSPQEDVNRVTLSGCAWFAATQRHVFLGWSKGIRYFGFSPFLNLGQFWISP